MVQRKSDSVLMFLVIGMFLTGLILADAAISRRLDSRMIRQRAEIVRVLTLTDLSLFTEARYTRHPSMTDFHSAFQDHPLSLEHFPSGSFIPPPPHLEPGSR